MSKLEEAFKVYLRQSFDEEPKGLTRETIRAVFYAGSSATLGIPKPEVATELLEYIKGLSKTVSSLKDLHQADKPTQTV